MCETGIMKLIRVRVSTAYVYVCTVHIYGGQGDNDPMLRGAVVLALMNATRISYVVPRPNLVLQRRYLRNMTS